MTHIQTIPGHKQQASLAVSYVAITSLNPYSSNARTHSKRQIRKIADSIREFGFTNPVLIDKENTIIAGHGRVEAAKLLTLHEVPTIRLEGLTRAQVRAYVIADNRLAEDAGWDKEILRIELQHLVAENEIDISLIGFEIPELDLILNPRESADDADDTVPPAGPSVCQTNDLWVLGDHRILCNDVRQQTTLTALMDGKRAAMVFTDPPYNVSIARHASGNGAIKHEDFAMAVGEMSSSEFEAFLQCSLGNLLLHSTPSSVHFVCMDWRHMSEVLAVGSRIYDSLLNLCVWVKSNGGMGSFYRSQHELVFVFRAGEASHRNNIQLGRFGRNRTNVWEYYSPSALPQRQDEEGNLLAMHPTVKPVSLVADAILDCSARGEIILDGFLGSGSTLMAAERVGRVCYGVEIDPKYVDVSIRRWQRLTGESAIHAESGRAFAEIELEVSRLV